MGETGGQTSALAETARLAADAEEAAERRLDLAGTARRQADADHHRWGARAETLAQALDHARARAGAERLEQVAGFMGAVLELVEVDDGYEAAFEAAAGDVLAAVVVDGIDAARAALAELQGASVAGAVLALPAPGWAGSARDQGPPGPVEEASVGAGQSRLRDRVRSRLPSVERWLDQLLAGTVVVEGGWTEAVDVSIARPDLILVTREGDRGAEGLWQLGAGSRGATAAAVEEARQHAVRAESACARAEMAWHEARGAATSARAEHQRAARAVEANLARQRAAADAHQRVEAELAEARSEHGVASSQRHELTARQQRAGARARELEGLLPAMEAEAAAQAERAAAQHAARSRLAQRTADLGARRRDLEVRAAGLAERRSMTTRRLEEVEERLRRNVAERDEASARLDRLQLAVQVTERLSGLVEGRQAELEAVLGRLREARRAEADAARARTEQLEALRRQRTTAERQLAETRERAGRIELESTEARVRLEGLTETIRRDLDCEPEGVRNAALPAAAARYQRIQPA